MLSCHYKVKSETDVQHFSRSGPSGTRSAKMLVPSKASAYTELWCPPCISIPSWLQYEESSTTELPEELILHIFSFLSDKDLCIVCRVNWYWHRLAVDNSLWVALYARQWRKLPESLRDRTFSWKELYWRRRQIELRYFPKTLVGAPPTMTAKEFYERLPADSHTFIRWGLQLYNEALSLPRERIEEAQQLYTIAAEEYEAAYVHNPQDDDALNNWGCALDMLARLLSGDAAEAKWRKAIGLYQAALALKPEKQESLYSWGNALLFMARRSAKDRPAEADALFTEARDKYQRVLALNPRHADASVSCARAITSQVQLKDRGEAEALYELCYTRYDAAVSQRQGQSQPVRELLLEYAMVLRAHAKLKDPGDDEAFRLFARCYEKYEAALALDPSDDVLLYKWGNTLSDEAQKREGRAAYRLLEMAAAKFEQSLRLNPDSPDALHSWALTFMDRANMTEGPPADALYRLCYEKCEMALRLNCKDDNLLNNWANALADQANNKDGDEADVLYQRSYEKYAAAFAIDPSDLVLLRNWACVIKDQAKKKKYGPEADALFRLSAEKLEHSVRLKADNHEAFYSWGSMLSDWGKQKYKHEDVETAFRLWKEADLKFEYSVSLKPSSYKALNTYGNALKDRAKLLPPGPEADALFDSAVEKYKTALACKPDFLTPLGNWGLLLMERAKRKRADDPARAALFAEAEQKLLAAEPKVWMCAFWLACLAALQGKEQQCRQWLELCYRRARLRSRRLSKEKDLDSVRSTPWFQELLVELKSGRTMPEAD